MTISKISLFLFLFLYLNINSINYYFVGFISLGQLINVMPFMNNLVKVTANGSHLLDAFEHSVSDYDINLGGGSRLLQMSGEWKIMKNPGQIMSKF